MSILPDHARNWPLWARLLHALIRAYCRIFHRMRAEASTLPEAGPALLAANHHAGPDPLFLIASNRRIISFMIAVEYYRVRSLTWVYERTGCIPVKRMRPTATSLRGVLARLEEGRVVGIFPEGGIHAPEERVHPKAGVAMLALESGAPVFPARISGIRQLPGSDLKTFLRPRRVRVRYGPEVDLADLRRRYSGDRDRSLLNEAAKRIVDAIYALPE
ncbi:lysophospholipid acyltransferase family protein [Thiohalorhabdus sp. Cl-TMA]|uniref:Lysophospholipid acyltransferase family protein n=1 Tax=Thiohalorhabdus methylotrophus TaxID=3242694 RepID=A0ABV4TV96_9GAMM